MSISVQCPGCAKKLKTNDHLAGKRIKCPGCGQVMLVPAAQAESQPEAIEPLRKKPTVPKPLEAVKAPLAKKPYAARKAVSEDAPALVSKGRRARWPWYVGGTAALCLVAGLVFVFTMPSKNTPPADPQSELSHKLIPAWVGGKWGYVDRQGKMVIDPQFEDLVLSGARDRVTVPRRLAPGEKASGVVVTVGEDRYTFETWARTCHSFVDGLAPAAKEKKWGFIDMTGAWKIQPAYEKALHFSEGNACVQSGKRWHLVNKDGQRVGQADFRAVLSFSEGLYGRVIQGQVGLPQQVRRIRGEARLQVRPLVFRESCGR
jgi:hypothetical protein